MLSDKISISQVLGCYIQKPDIVEETGIQLSRQDFPELFHRLIYATVNNLYLDGAKQIDSITIDGYLAQYPNQYAVFNDNNGMDYIDTIVDQAVLSNFKYHANRIRKFTMLRAYVEQGIDVSSVYDDTIISQVDYEAMQSRFDSMSLRDIANEINGRFITIEDGFLSSEDNKEQHASQGMRELKERLKDAPEYGSPLNGKIINTIVRGARRKKLYMRSAPSGVGKTRLAVGDAMRIGLSHMYDTKLGQWVRVGVGEPVLFITTELEEEEIQTMMIAYASGVNEECILNGDYTPEEEQRVDKAIDIIEECDIRLAYLPDFDIDEVERTIKKHIISYDIHHVFFDYIHTSLQLLEELSQASQGMRLREDNVLLMFVTRLKQICNDLDVFLYTATQVNDSYQHANEINEGVLRGAKSMADKVDIGVVALEPTSDELESLSTSLRDNFKGQFGYREPNIVFHIYKNRRGKYNKVKVWSYVDLGTCRTEDLFVTTNNNEIIPFEEVDIHTFTPTK